MTESLILFILNSVLDPDERSRAFESGFHLKSIKFVHGVNLVSILISSDDEATSWLVVHWVSHTSQFKRDLVSPSIFGLYEDSSYGNYARSFINFAVLLVSE